MMRLRHPLAVALGGLTLAVTMAGSAVAATGTFHWFGPEGQPYYVENLPDNRCLDMSQEARGAQNRTSGPVVVYAQKQCKGQATRLAPGKSAPADAPFASLRLSPR
ncbi:hypothetical protein LRS74_02875 [Streptomyces sp. LX-29]|uniref:hypothetical protein n=1 Tax=Streptomyces sp. LX-29 TaxID=2900152 RepID=UPI00240D2B8E|nr:hypothetical protein [Streptomyces sp. LX-29]WFB06101.1 hypothetical protein LRS74_02875 [Streptomyces sp. LX-29]